MKRVLAVCLFSLPIIAHAASLELGIGVSQMIHTRNTVWWQRGFPHTLSGRQPFIEIGLRGRMLTHGAWRAAWHVDAVSLGHFGVNSEDTPRDSNYSGVPPTYCNGPCLPLANYIGSGRIYGVQALASLRFGGAWHVGIEAGPLLYWESWRLDVPNWYAPDGTVTPIASYSKQWALGFAGGSLRVIARGQLRSDITATAHHFRAIRDHGRRSGPDNMCSSSSTFSETRVRRLPHPNASA